MKPIKLFCFALGFTIALSQTSCTQQIAGLSTTLPPTEKVRPMDEICDLIFTGENADDDAHTTTTGDIDGDGYADLILGAHGYNRNQGRAYLYYGGPDMDNKPDLVFDGEPNAASHFGWLLGSGDVDNDNYDDIIIGAADYNNLRGRAYLYYGGPRAVMDNQADLFIEGENAADRFCVGWNDIVCEDIDGDRYDDIVIPAIGYDNHRGRAYLYWGQARSAMDAECDLTFTPPDAGGSYDMGIACGDVDNDGYKDIVVGARLYKTDEGRAYLYWGDSQGSMDANCDLIFEAEAASHGNFGANVGIGDVDNDGYEDIVIGANRFNHVQGRAYLYWGASRENMDTECDLKFAGEAGPAGFAELCICGGDVNADGYVDILIGARQYDNFRGRVYLYLGGTKEKMDAHAELVLTGENEGDWFGDPPGGSFGDFNNDGYDDLAIGAKGYKAGSEQGRAYLYYGGPKN